MEYACAEYPNEPIRKRDWLQDVYTWAQTDNVAHYYISIIKMAMV